MSDLLLNRFILVERPPFRVRVQVEEIPPTQLADSREVQASPEAALELFVAVLRALNTAVPANTNMETQANA